MLRWFLTLSTVLALSGCGYNDFQRLDEQAKSAWSEVLNQYQRRADLVPNIVATVKGEAAFEQETLTKVIEARAKATSIQITPETLNNPEALKKFQAVPVDFGLTGARARRAVGGGFGGVSVWAGQSGQTLTTFGTRGRGGEHSFARIARRNLED